MVYIGDPDQSNNGLTPDGRPKPPKDYLGLALFSLLCCCLPFGIVALVKSLEVRILYSHESYSIRPEVMQKVKSLRCLHVIGL